MKRSAIRIILPFCCALGLIAVIGMGLSFGVREKSTEAVEVVGEKLLYPGGQSVGIRMEVKGVLVVGLEEIETEDSVVSPGYEAGLQIGDMILAVNGREVASAEEVAEAANDAAGPVRIKVLRKEQTLEFTVSPAREYKSGSYKLGIWVKEKIAGIGTLSFYDPDSGVFAALGHGIYESKTNTLLDAESGLLLPTEVRSIKSGARGIPGEIRGVFCDEDTAIGEVRRNSRFGIYAKELAAGGAESGAGTSEEASGAFALGEPMVMAYRDQVKKGEAQILTTIDGRRVEAFDIRITSVSRQREPDAKGLEIEVTDERLLSYCGGIVQGMSGSPIIQDGRLVGAVTHVFVNDPTRGYGIFAEWMVENCRNIS